MKGLTRLFDRLMGIIFSVNGYTWVINFIPIKWPNLNDDGVF